MSTYTTTSTYFCDTDAEFRALIVIFLATMTNCGWTQTGDTGQVNTTTVTYPGANNTDATNGSWLGFMDDAFHATAPLYIKATFGRGNAVGTFRVNVSFSMTGTNGTGTLLNGSGIHTRTLSHAPSTRLVSDASLYNVFASGAAGRWGMVWMPDTSSAPFGSWMSIDRWKDATGASTGDGFTIYTGAFQTSGALTSDGVMNFRKGAPYTPTFRTLNNQDTVGFGAPNWTDFGASLRAQNDTVSTLHDGKVWAFPLYPKVPGQKYPLTSILMASVHDFPNDFSTVNLTLYSTSMTWKPQGFYSGGALAANNGGNFGILLRYE